MTKGDKIIWDSGFGYEIGYYIEESKYQYYQHEVDLVTGNVQGIVAHPMRELRVYTPESIQELTAKYGYEKSFSEVF